MRSLTPARILRISTIGLIVPLFGCQSQLMEYLREPPEQEDQRIAIQQAFANAGFVLRLPVFGESESRYRCRTQHFDITFPEADAGIALHLASQADSIYEMVEAWFGFGLPYDRLTVRVFGLSGGMKVTEDMTWRYGSLNLRSGARLIDVISVNIPPLVSVPLALVAEKPALELSMSVDYYLKTNRFVFAYKVARVFLNRRVNPITNQFIPWWLHTGIAAYLATEERDDRLFADQLLMEVGLSKTQLPLNQLPDPEAESTWRSHRRALSFLLFLHHRYGEENLRTMVQQVINAPENPIAEEVISSIYGKTLLDLEAEWKAAVRDSTASFYK